MKPLQNELEVIDEIQKEYPGVVIDLSMENLNEYIDNLGPNDKISYSVAFHDEEYSPIGEWTRNACWYDVEGQDFGWLFLDYDKSEIRDILINNIKKFTQESIDEGVTKLHVSKYTTDLRTEDFSLMYVLTIPSRLLGEEYSIYIEKV